VTDDLHRPQILTKDHDVTRFDCGKEPLNTFLQKYALPNQKGGATRTYVMVLGEKVVGYYSLTPASIEPGDAPERILHGQGRYQVPAILMARFAIDRSQQGKGFGKTLFRDALLRALEAEEIIGGRTFLVHAKDEDARSFYKRFNMEESPIDPFHLFLLFKDVRRILNR
jgi:GNAT superfamily N-acetyltransferase